ncbi:MAG: hypothetical protein WKF88_01520 [Ferruginibacter sp.]
MKTKMINVLALFYLSMNSYAQQVSLSTDLGIAVAKTEDYKTNMLMRNTSLNYEFFSNSKKKIAVNIGTALKTFAARIDNSIYSTRSALSVHAAFKPYFKVTEISKIFVQFGTYYNYMFKEILELKNPQQKITKHNLGQNIGLISGVGLHSNISTKFIIEASLESGGDILSNYTAGNNFTSQANYSFKIAFCYSL